MKHFLLSAALAVALLLFAPQAFAFGTKDVVGLTQDGVSDDVIISKIENSGTVFILDRKDIERLKDDGVSDEVIEAMLKTEKYAEDDDGGYYGYPHRTYVYGAPYYYDPFWYPRSSFSFGLGLGFGGHSHHGYRNHYYRPRYSPNSGGNLGPTRYRGSYGDRSGWSGSGRTSTGGRTRTR